MILVSPQVFKRGRDLKIGYFRWQTAGFYQIGCLGGFRDLKIGGPSIFLGLQTSKSAILDGKQLFS